MSRSVAFFLVATWAVGHASADEWYQGGTLHGSTLEEWTLANEAEKLATSSDYIVSVLGEEQVLEPQALKSKAGDVVECVDTLVPVIGKSYDIRETKTNSVALLCINQFSENEWR